MIEYFYEDTDFSLEQALGENMVHWLGKVAAVHQREIAQLNYIFCSDAYLHKINVEYLDHDTFTDIITFDNSEHEGIEGDIFISTDRVQENAQAFEVTFKEELCRVMAHGLLHLMGFKDKTAKEIKEMREKEEASLHLAREASIL